MKISHFIILVHDARAPVLLGPMSESTRAGHMRELRARHEEAGLHELDIEAHGADRVDVRVNSRLVEAET